MSLGHLVACPSCARHLRVSEALCPFCGGTVDADLRARAAPRPPAMRLSRAALFALGTATGAAALGSAACSSSSTPQTADAGESASLGTHYGMAPMSSTESTESSSTESSNSSSSPTFTAVAHYGGMSMMMTDSETGSSHSSSTDAGIDHGVDAAYGGPPPDDFCDTGCGGLPDGALA